MPPFAPPPGFGGAGISAVVESVLGVGNSEASMAGASVWGT
jgi:hypothetical protein